MTSKANWICQKCGQSFTRHTSGKRHNAKLHSNMSLIIEFSEYYVGITKGKYNLPEGPPALFKRNKSFNSNFLDIKFRNENNNNNNNNNQSMSNENSYDCNNHSNSNFKDSLLFNHFIPDNAALIDSIIEKYEQKLLPFLSKEEINKIIYKHVIIPLSTFIDSKEAFYKHMNRIDNLVGYIRILKRGGLNEINISSL
jgi:hypothetical protein